MQGAIGTLVSNSIHKKQVNDYMNKTSIDPGLMLLSNANKKRLRNLPHFTPQFDLGHQTKRDPSAEDLDLTGFGALPKPPLTSR
jgi:hypothetical protein